MLTLFARPHSGARATMSSSSVATRCARLARAMVTPLIERPRARAIVLVRARRRGGARRRDDRRRLDREFDRESSARTTRTRERRARERDWDVCARVRGAWADVSRRRRGRETRGEGAEGDASEAAASESVTEEKTMTTESAEDGGVGVRDKKPAKTDLEG